MLAVVCGAGIAGLASAYFLARAGWDVLVVERAAGMRTAGYLIDFTASGYDAAEAGGLLPALQARHRPVAAVVYVDQDDRELVFGPEAQFVRYLGYHNSMRLPMLSGLLGRYFAPSLKSVVKKR